MKKRWICGAAACLMLLSGCGAGGGEEVQPYTAELAQEILDSGAFTDQLEELDCDTAWALYGLEDAGLSREQLTDGLIRRSAGATCEELALLVFTDSDGAETAVGHRQGTLSDLHARSGLLCGQSRRELLLLHFLRLPAAGSVHKSLHSAGPPCLSDTFPYLAAAQNHA